MTALVRHDAVILVEEGWTEVGRWPWPWAMAHTPDAALDDVLQVEVEVQLMHGNAVPTPARYAYRRLPFPNAEGGYDVQTWVVESYSMAWVDEAAGRLRVTYELRDMAQVQRMFRQMAQWDELKE